MVTGCEKLKEQIMLARGHFWFMVPPFVDCPGVNMVLTGYTGGSSLEPKYESVLSGETGHRLAVQISHDAAVISFEKLLQIYWKAIDPIDTGGQFTDRGHPFITAIYYDQLFQKEIAEQSKKKLDMSKIFPQPVVTDILKAKPFYPAEEKHQNYHKKLPFHYYYVYRKSGRATFIQKYWQNQKEDSVLIERLTPLQYEVTQNNKTERPYANEFHEFYGEGIYVL
jgi:peptide methionine sulfoxide reductase msrA/msrB